MTHPLAVLVIFSGLITAGDTHRTGPVLNHTPACLRLTSGPNSACIEFPRHPVQLI